MNLESLKEAKDLLEAEKNRAPQDQALRYSLEIQEKEAEILEAEYNIKSKTVQIENLEATLENKEYVSPVDGTISSINNGEASEYGEPKPFMVIKETGALRVQGYVNEMNMSDINLGDAVTVKSRMDERTWSGVVSKIDLEKPEQSGENEFYLYDSYAAGISADTSSKYPFYVELDDTDGLIIGQHVYIMTEGVPGGPVSDDVYDIGEIDGFAFDTDKIAG